MKTFVEANRAAFAQLREQKADMDAGFRAAVAYFVEDAATAAPDVFFTPFRTFAADLDRAWVAVAAARGPRGPSRPGATGSTELAPAAARKVSEQKADMDAGFRAAVAYFVEDAAPAAPDVFFTPFRTFA
ncbi:hypothetical protein HK405_001347, partial [Cladochytrium tenue]